MAAPDRNLPTDELALLTRAADWSGLTSLEDLTESALLEITKSQGVDFATAVVYDRLVNSAQHGGFIRRIDQFRGAAGPEFSGTAVAIAPGAFYVEYPHTGAGGEVILTEAARCGCRSEVIPTGSVATPADNGRAICDWLAGQSAQRIVLVSLSKGGADVKMALMHPDADRLFQNVIAWINVGGILDGSPMVRWILARKLPTLTYRLLFWWFGHDFSIVTALDRQTGSEPDSELRLPDHLRAIHVAGVPLRKHMSSRRARRWHRRLALFGPNDGVTLLSDVLRWPGRVLPVWGTDHYLQKGWAAGELISALLAYLAADAELAGAGLSAAETARSGSAGDSPAIS